ncbi:uncharacterized protein LOC135106234 isoform X6 [Scylla paramamosain]|uniref:uncharacterized protein LOC135106234 isoform X6 n=1 Tax=Scylla paramamosain TaxID=85552 RepID=UPI003083B301
MDNSETVRSASPDCRAPTVPVHSLLELSFSFPGAVGLYMREVARGVARGRLVACATMEICTDIKKTPSRKTTPSPASRCAPPRHHGPAVTPFHLLHDAG